jgi:hypothetical protein
MAGVASGVDADRAVAEAADRLVVEVEGAIGEEQLRTFFEAQMHLRGDRFGVSRGAVYGRDVPAFRARDSQARAVFDRRKAAIRAKDRPGVDHELAGVTDARN